MTDASNRASQPRRLWFQFSRRKLLFVVTLVALVAGSRAAWRAYVEPYRQQRETMKLIEALGGSYKTEPGGSAWMRVWFGTDKFQDIVLVNVADCDDPEKFLVQFVSLPRLETLVVGSRAFSDEHLSRLKQLTTLSGLVLDSTDVTDDGINALNRALPELAIHKSQRRSIAVICQLSVIEPILTELSTSLPVIRDLVGDEYFEQAIYLKLGHYRINDAGLVHLKGLTTLQMLWLEDTLVTDAGLEHLKGLTNLQALELGQNRVSDAGLVHLKGLSNLQVLTLNHTLVTDAGLAHLNGLTNLHTIDLSVNRITGAGLKHLKGLTNLQSLNLQYTHMSDVGLAHLGGLTNLRRLELEGTKVSDAGLAHLKGFTNLQSLSLWDTSVSDFGLAYLEGLTNLQVLNLRGTQVSLTGVKKLQKALPKCTIHHSWRLR